MLKGLQGNVTWKSRRCLCLFVLFEGFPLFWRLIFRESKLFEDGVTFVCWEGGWALNQHNTALTLMSGDKNSLEHFDMLTNISTMPALNIQFLPLPVDFEQIVAVAVPAALLKLMASKAATLLLQTTADSIWAIFLQFASDGRNWISITETGSRSQINRWFPYLTAWWIRDADSVRYWNQTLKCTYTYSPRIKYCTTGCERIFMDSIWDFFVSVLLLERLNNKHTLNYSNLS